MVPTAQTLQPVIHLMARSAVPGEGLTKHEAQRVAAAYYVDLALDEKEGSVVEAQIDSLLRDLVVLVQKQLAALAENAMEQQIINEGKAVILDYEPTDSCQQQDHFAIMVLEESEAAPTRPVVLITPQLGGRSRWFIQHKPHLKQGEGKKNVLS